MQTWYKSKARMQCTELHTNNNAGPDAPATVCTKIAQDYAKFKLHTLKDKEAKEHFAKAKGWYGLVVPQCDLRKETVCVNGNCDVKKQAVCNTVCKFKGGGGGMAGFLKDPKFVKKNCFPELCEGEYGELACTVVATMG